MNKEVTQPSSLHPPSSPSSSALLIRLAMLLANRSVQFDPAAKSPAGPAPPPPPGFPANVLARKALTAPAARTMRPVSLPLALLSAAAWSLRDFRAAVYQASRACSLVARAISASASCSRSFRWYSLRRFFKIACLSCWALCLTHVGGWYGPMTRRKSNRKQMH